MPKPGVTPAGYVLPRRPRWQGGWNLKAAFAAVMVFVVVSFGATEWLAAALSNPMELGEPLFVYRGLGVFPPFGALKLWSHFAGSPQISKQVREDLWIGCGVTVVGGFLAASLAYWFMSLIRDRDSTENLENLHGSAEWADKKTITETGLLTATDGVYVGAWREPVTRHLHFLLHAGPEPVLVFAPTRSGKGVSCIIPSLLQWRDSAFVLDIKGENFDLTAGWRRSVGQRVLMFAPASPDQSCCFNPLNEIRWDTDYDVSDARAIADSVIRNGEDNALYKHFEDAAVDLVSAGILHLGYTFRRLSPPREVTLSDVLTLYSSPGKDIADVLAQMQSSLHDPGGMSAPTRHWKDISGRLTATHPYVSKAVQRQLNRAEREGSSVQSSVVTPMAIYDDPIVQKTIRRSDFSIRDLVYDEKPMTLYFKVPPTPRDRNQLRPLVRLFIDLIFNQLLAEKNETRHHLLLMLDEFAELKQMPNIATALSTMAGYKLKPYLVVQSLSQIIEIYGPNQSISNNCFIKIAFQTDDLNTCRLISEMSGIQTVERETTNYSGQRTDFYLKHVFRSVELVQRPLITPDEVRRMRPPKKENNDRNGKILEPGEAIIFMNGVPPIFGEQSLFFLSDTFLKRTQLPKPAFPTAAEEIAAPVNKPQPTTLDPVAIAHEAMEEALYGPRDRQSL
jgi:type IV secretion system protein VirD4